MPFLFANKLGRVKSLKYQVKYVIGEAKYVIRDWQRVITEQDKLAEIVNQKEIRVVGLRRSGNHAVINWINKQESGYVSHLNNIVPKCNPYRLLYRHYPKERLREESWGYFRPKDCLIYSYEDYCLKQITDRQFENKHDLYLGKSKIRYDVLILRDPFNLLASRIKSNMLPVKNKYLSLSELWINYAKEFLQETNYLQNNKVCINYNRWVSDKNYRHQIADSLQLNFTDAGFDEVRGYGGGSSFDGRDFHGLASNMDVNNRWKNITDHPKYHQFLANEQLMSYSQKIFGDFEEITK
ncbi:MAG: hypothetical protein AB4368_18515 [Xenococcaceae cyanobacterium]